MKIYGSNLDNFKLEVQNYFKSQLSEIDETTQRVALYCLGASFVGASLGVLVTKISKILSWNFALAVFLIAAGVKLISEVLEKESRIIHQTEVELAHIRKNHDL